MSTRERQRQKQRCVCSTPVFLVCTIFWLLGRTRHQPGSMTPRVRVRWVPLCRNLDLNGKILNLMLARLQQEVSAADSLLLVRKLARFETKKVALFACARTQIRTPQNLPRRGMPKIKSCPQTINSLSGSGDPHESDGKRSSAPCSVSTLDLSSR